MILDIVDQAETERAVELCRSLRQGGQAVRILLLVRPERAVVRTVAVETKNAGLADDFVFYDSSLGSSFGEVGGLLASRRAAGDGSFLLKSR